MNVLILLVVGAIDNVVVMPVVFRQTCYGASVTDKLQRGSHRLVTSTVRVCAQRADVITN